MLAVALLFFTGAAHAGADTTFDTALTKFTDFLEGAAPELLPRHRAAGLPPVPGSTVSGTGVPTGTRELAPHATTIVAAAPTPCSPRAMPSTTMFGDTRHTSDAIMCSTIPPMSGRRRPSESDSGPRMS